MWNYIKELYLGKNNFIWTYDVIRRCKSEEKQTLSQDYADFNKIYEIKVLLAKKHEHAAKNVICRIRI